MWTKLTSEEALKKQGSKEWMRHSKSFGERKKIEREGMHPFVESEREKGEATN